MPLSGNKMSKKKKTLTVSPPEKIKIYVTIKGWSEGAVVVLVWPFLLFFFFCLFKGFVIGPLCFWKRCWNCLWTKSVINYCYAKCSFHSSYNTRQHSSCWLLYSCVRANEISWFLRLADKTIYVTEVLGDMYGKWKVHVTVTFYDTNRILL